ncbi:hypothetical protein PHYSODRAFT_333013 [Phytophthora sojae]|uniref:BED-type domain-containing protein n=1 Tax=Phytophthora sojae (strain P6497) TaxID=1094619 RepID=G4ZMD0_PHYSP|nr:hypothetical protein PHYSODRAFT_333013 [Phytophthora sojae]EGZ14663.1 hypothetical protein PHYSODRAFT_333013 [Phytophthora sojae]|eukprot:XP_009528412.1 hypothetical protein PHYSODRAFT_333013 [Phytophthora sojae]
MVLTSSQICSMLFTDVGNGFYNCTSCDKQYKKGNGYTNLLSHLRRNHDNYELEAQEASRRQNPLRLHLVSTRTRDLYRWLEWVVCDRLPFAFVERRLTRLNASLSLVSEDTLSKYIVLIFELLELRVARELPASFGLVLDGWTSGGRHYIAIFAVFGSDSTGITGGGADNEYYDDLECSSRRFLLLTFAPVEVEEDMGAQSQYDLIADTLSRYNKPWSAVKFMVGDNCSVNQCIGRKEGAIPFIGCASHRFNLAVKDFLKTEDELIAKVHALMTKLRTIKGRALLRRVSHLSPLLRYDTRWSSTYEMVARYVKLQPAIIKLGHDLLVKYEVQPLLLRRAEHERARALEKDLEKFEGGVKEYPALKSRLAATAPIVNNPHLELGLVKLQREEALTAAERSACAEFRSTTLEWAPAREDGNSSIVKAAFKKRKAPRRSQYVDVAYVPPTSNEYERFFSAAKLVLTDVRKSLSPTMLEMLMCLQYNRDLWDVNTVEQVRARIGSN